MEAKGVRSSSAGSQAAVSHPMWVLGLEIRPLTTPKYFFLKKTNLKNPLFTFGGHECDGQKLAF